MIITDHRMRGDMARPALTVGKCLMVSNLRPTSLYGKVFDVPPVKPDGMRRNQSRSFEPGTKSFGPTTRHHLCKPNFLVTSEVNGSQASHLGMVVCFYNPEKGERV
jgi:hypothetical protein